MSNKEEKTTPVVETADKNIETPPECVYNKTTYCIDEEAHSVCIRYSEGTTLRVFIKPQTQPYPVVYQDNEGVYCYGCAMQIVQAARREEAPSTFRGSTGYLIFGDLPFKTTGLSNLENCVVCDFDKLESDAERLIVVKWLLKNVDHLDTINKYIRSWDERFNEEWEKTVVNIKWEYDYDSSAWVNYVTQPSLVDLLSYIDDNKLVEKVLLTT